MNKCKGCPFARKLLSGQVYCPFFSCAKDILKKNKNKEKVNKDNTKSYPADND